MCPEQTAAFLNCKFVSQLTLLTGTLWGMLSDKYGNFVLMGVFGICNIAGLILLILGARFPSSPSSSSSSSSFAAPLESFLLYIALVLKGIGATVGGMLTVDTGLLFYDKGDGGSSGGGGGGGDNNDNSNGKKQLNLVIAFLNTLFDAGAMAYLGLWAIEKQLSVSNNPDGAYSYNPNLIVVLVGYLGLAVVCIGGYAYFFRAVQAINNKNNSSSNNKSENENKNDDEVGVVEQHHDANKNEETRDGGDPICQPTKIETASPQPTPPERAAPSMDPAADDGHTTPDDDSDPPPYVRVAMRSPRDQLLSKFFVLLGTWFSFHTASNLWTLTTARDFLGGLGDDDYGNRYLGIFTMLTPFSIVALPFLDKTIRSFGFHAALQAVNGLEIAHGIFRVFVSSLNAQIAGFVVFTFFRCFLYAVALSCVAAVVGPNAIGTATGTLFVLSGVSSFANIGLAHLAVERDSFVVPDSVFLFGTIPLIYLTYEIGRALEKDAATAESSSSSAPQRDSLTPPPPLPAAVVGTPGEAPPPRNDGSSSSSEC